MPLGSLLKPQDGDGHENVSRLKCEFALPQTLSRLFHLVYSSNVNWQFFLELNSKGLHESSGKEKEMYKKA